MNKLNILVIALIVLIFIGFISSRKNVSTTTTTSKSVIVSKPKQYNRHYGYIPPSHYNQYKSQYY